MKFLGLSKSSWLHLRLPFSIFLLPIYLLALTQIPAIPWTEAAIVFVCLHIFLYPASQAYNSYFDRDEQSIGGLERPPAVEEELLVASYIFDLIALLLAVAINVEFFIAVFILGVLSKIYSHPRTRWKAKPWLGWLTVALFQGLGVYVAVLLALDPSRLLSPEVWYIGALSCFFFGGAYPLTQIYQHDEDARRGDMTLSRWLGLRGTMLFALAVSGLGLIGFIVYFYQQQRWDLLIAMQLLLLPSLLYLLRWAWQLYHNPLAANYQSAMRMNKLSALGMLSFFSLWVFWL